MNTLIVVAFLISNGMLFQITAPEYAKLLNKLLFGLGITKCQLDTERKLEIVCFSCEINLLNMLHCWLFCT